MIDLTASGVIDVHCHPWRNEDLLARDPAYFEDRTTMMGICQISSGQASEDLSRHLAMLTDTTPFALTLRRRLARHLGCEPTREAVAAARRAALRADSPGYNRTLFKEAGIAGLVYDEGYRPRDRFEGSAANPSRALRGSKRNYRSSRYRTAAR